MARNSLVGLCPRNKFYADDHNMETFLAKAANISKKVYLIVPEKISVYNHEATHSKDPKKRAHRDANSILNRTENALRKISSDRFIHLDWNDFEENQDYLDMVEKVAKCYENDRLFHDAVNEVTRSALTSLVKTCPGRYFHETDIAKAANYYISEIAMADSLWSVLGWDESGEYWLLYHKGGNPFQYFFEGQYSLKPRSQMKYRII